MFSNTIKKITCADCSSPALGLSLILAILVTRGSHFGNAALLPDATLAALFLGGILLQRAGWLAALLAAAFLADAWAVNFQGVSSFCVTPAYLGLIPTYAMTWGCGWLLHNQNNDAFLPARFVMFGFAAAAMGFVVSNAFWYVFSGYFGQMPISTFIVSVSKYAVSYIGYTMLYLGLAWTVERAVKIRARAAGTSQQAI
jgi:hypothetical protein